MSTPKPLYQGHLMPEGEPGMQAWVLLARSEPSVQNYEWDSGAWVADQVKEPSERTLKQGDVVQGVSVFNDCDDAQRWMAATLRGHL